MMKLSGVTYIKVAGQRNVTHKVFLFSFAGGLKRREMFIKTISLVL